MEAKKIISSDIPIPPKPLNLNSILNSGKKNEELTDEEKAILNENRFFQSPKPKKRYWLLPTIGLCISIILPIVIYFLHISIALWFISMIFSVPIFFINIIGLIIYLFRNGKKVKGKIIKILYTNYINATFFKENKQKEVITCILNKDGISFSLGKQEYVLDMDAVWFDNKQPFAYYLPGLPNPLLFDFQENPQQFIREIFLSQMELDENGNPKNEKVFYTDKKGRMVDISYSSENLQLLKKDKIFAELHRDPDTEKMLIAALGLCALLTIALIISLMFRRSEVVVNNQLPKTVAQSIIFMVGLWQINKKH